MMYVETDPRAEANQVLADFWQVLESRHTSLDDAAAAAFTLWCQLLRVMPPSSRSLN